jgi:hypothetical protein
MADWLNVLLAGPYTIQVNRDGIAVDPASVGASLDTTGGVITLQTPPGESHQWDVRVTPGANIPQYMRISSASLTHPDGITSAQAFTNTPGQSIELTGFPGAVAPDPATFTLPALVAGLSVVEEPIA